MVGGGQIQTRELVALQEKLRTRVIRRPTVGKIRLIGGVDVSIRNNEARAAVVALSWPGLKLVEQATAIRPVDLPYIPGLLGFRELPSILDAYARLESRPDVFIVDGHGLAHPRRCGIACMFGLEIDRPAIGCGKSLYVGEHKEPAARRGSRTALRHKGEVIASVLRTRDGVKPVYVSIGHRVDLSTAVRILLQSASKYRLPEPIRQADRVAGEI